MDNYFKPIVSDDLTAMFSECIYFDKSKNHKVFAGVLISKEGDILLGLKNYGFGKGKWQHSFAGKVKIYPVNSATDND